MAKRFSVLDSDSGDGDAHQGYSPEILPPSSRSSVAKPRNVADYLLEYSFLGANY